MYKPNHQLTNKIVNFIAEISAAREAILDAPILPSVEKELKLEALISRTHHSTSIEGNPLSKDEVRKIISGGMVTARKKDKQEIINYKDVLDYIDGIGKKEKNVTEKIILELHRLITKDILPKPKSGHYRKDPVYVVDGFGRTVFTPPNALAVPHLVKDLAEWLQSKECLNLYPVLVGGIAHYEFVRIHPFEDGNGRCGRALATLILYQREFDIKDFFGLDDYYNENRSLYYAALQSVDPQKIEITQWLEYFVEGVAIQMSKIKDKVATFSRDRILKEKKGQLFLNERQWKLLEYVKERGSVSLQEYLSFEGKISERTARNDFKFLVDGKIIKKVGEGPATRYELRI